MSYEEDQIDRLYDEVTYLRKDNERLARKLEVIHHELNAWKEYAHRIIDLKAEALLTQPMQPIIIKGPLYPADLSCPDALCLRIDHTHTPEGGCWEPRPREVRIREMKKNWPHESSAAEVAAKGKDKEAP